MPRRASMASVPRYMRSSQRSKGEYLASQAQAQAAAEQPCVRVEGNTCGYCARSAALPPIPSPVLKVLKAVVLLNQDPLAALHTPVRRPPGSTCPLDVRHVQHARPAAAGSADCSTLCPAASRPSCSCCCCRRPGCCHAACRCCRPHPGPWYVTDVQGVAQQPIRGHRPVGELQQPAAATERDKERQMSHARSGRCSGCMLLLAGQVAALRVDCTVYMYT